MRRPSRTPRAAALPRAKKSLGQHFLHDAGVCRRIVAALDIGAQDRVLEIGPGPGALSRWIAEAAPAAYAVVEKDTALAREFGRIYPRAAAAAADALDCRWERLVPEGGWKLAGNLPYNVASPLIWEIVSRCRGLERLVCMVQKEVGRRLAAAPGSGEYGALSVWVQSFVAVRRLFDVGPGAFVPRPKVDSAVLVLTPRSAGPLRLPAGGASFRPAALSGLLRMCFQQRRKQLGTILKGRWGTEVEAWFAARGLAVSARPEELSPLDFQELSNILE
ncbi:MAG: 16S rRNA (adenine(1518)-N(6)/adenine(1519)-N(6))-dimethyltransferase RsmA [Thermodesulfobacteriota bacterium]